MSTRRKFLHHAGLITGGTVLATAMNNKAFAYFNNNIMPSDRFNIGVIGLNGMGWANASAAMKVPGVVISALCDIDQSVIAGRIAELKSKNIDTKNIAIFSDYRKLLAHKDIDAVIIGTPDHWHALQMIHACEAGKDVYVEKPVGNSIAECSAMVAAQEKYKRVVQAGQWQRSQQHFGDAVNFVRSGKLGAIRNVKAWCYSQSTPMQPKADAPVPEGVDYTTWLGPAQLRPYNRNRFHYSFRWFWDYAGGLMTDWGVHLLDYALLGMNATTPNTITAIGGKYADPNAASETPDMLNVLYGFDKFSIAWEQTMGITNGNYGRDHGVAFQGNNGTLILNRSGWEVIEESRSKDKIIVPLNPSIDNGLEKHWANFIEVSKSRQLEKLHCSIQEGAKVASLCQMGNIAHRSGQKLQWDASKQRFTDAAVNDKYLSAVYHNGYSMPKV
jgi:predicted dehydrogenase